MGRARRPGGRGSGISWPEESPGSSGAGCRVTPGRGDPWTGPQKTDRRSARGNPGVIEARVKRWGKSPPAGRQRSGARQPPPGARPSSGRGALRGAGAASRPMPAGRPLEAAGNRRPREMTATPWPSHGGQNPAYRPSGAARIALRAARRSDPRSPFPLSIDSIIL